ncbi:unnamed protein product [Paramecium octaurelia]|uniref:Uncharacterized protein n=1 Tax=Paramecium octaurelia TaxID=43137 RepID=A0A8S1UF26_PAROT|nr:unnamed protein product [Paramecium octaurelia]
MRWISYKNIEFQINNQIGLQLNKRMNPIKKLHLISLNYKIEREIQIKKVKNILPKQANKRETTKKFQRRVSLMNSKNKCQYI